jgi:hypothetical protein
MRGFSGQHADINTWRLFSDIRQWRSRSVVKHSYWNSWQSWKAPRHSRAVLAKLDDMNIQGKIVSVCMFYQRNYLSDFDDIMMGSLMGPEDGLHPAGEKKLALARSSSPHLFATPPVLFHLPPHDYIRGCVSNLHPYHTYNPCHIKHIPHPHILFR